MCYVYGKNCYFYFVFQDYKEFGRPKKPMSSYLLFCNKYRDSFKDLNFVDIQVSMKNKWYALPEEEKSTWNTQAQKLKDEYRFVNASFNYKF